VPPPPWNLLDLVFDDRLLKPVLDDWERVAHTTLALARRELHLRPNDEVLGLRVRALARSGFTVSPAADPPAAFAIRLHRGDLPHHTAYTAAVAIDTEAMGLDPNRDRLCVVQLSPGDGSADVVQIAAGQNKAPNIARLLTDKSVLKIFHYARFDLGMLANTFGVMAEPVYCTKIASRLARTYTDKHGLKDLVRELLGIDLSKQQQSSDWGADQLNEAQLSYAATDVLHLHGLRERLDIMLAREGRSELAASCFRFLPDRVRLDLAGWAQEDIFSHSV
jgi:ribonuclease D